MSKAKALFIHLLKLIFAVVLIWWLVTRQDIQFSELKALLTPWVAIFSVSLVFISILISSERWRGILKSQGFILNRIQTFKMTMIGMFFNFAIPGGVGGDVVKGFYIVRNHPENKMKAAMTLLIDRVFGLFSMVVLALLVLVFSYQTVLSSPELYNIFYTLSLIFLAMFLFWCFAFSRRLHRYKIVPRLVFFLPGRKKLLRLYETLALYRDKKTSFFIAVFQSLVAQSLSVLFCVYVGHTLGYNIPLATYFFAVPVGFMITAIPISPAGVGVGQAAFFYLFEQVSPGNGSVGPLAITAYQIVNFLLALIGAYYYLTFKKQMEATNDHR